MPGLKGGAAMRVGIYARVSTADKDQDLDTQLLPLREFCGAQGWAEVQEFADKASATDLKGANRQRLFILAQIKSPPEMISPVAVAHSARRKSSPLILLHNSHSIITSSGIPSSSTIFHISPIIHSKGLFVRSNSSYHLLLSLTIFT